MWMKLWQILLFTAGCFLLVPFMPFPLPPNLDKGQYGAACFGIGVAVSWLGSVGISHLAAFLRGERTRKRRTDSSAERIDRRRQTLLED